MLRAGLSKHQSEMKDVLGAWVGRHLNIWAKKVLQVRGPHCVDLSPVWTTQDTPSVPLISLHKPLAHTTFTTYTQISDWTDLSTESGSGPIQLARARYRAACRTVAESPPHCMNAPQQTHIPIKLCCEAWGREIADWQIDRRCRRSGVGRTPSHGLLMVMLIEIASVLCRSVSQEAVDTR